MEEGCRNVEKEATTHPEEFPRLRCKLRCRKESCGICSGKYDLAQHSHELNEASRTQKGINSSEGKLRYRTGRCDMEEVVTSE